MKKTTKEEIRLNAEFNGMDEAYENNDFEEYAELEEIWENEDIDIEKCFKNGDYKNITGCSEILEKYSRFIEIEYNRMLDMAAHVGYLK